MRIHTNTLTEADIRAMVPSTAYVGKLTTHGSRSHARAFDLNLGGSGRTGGQWGQTDGKAATWDEWGMFLAALYKADPNAKTPYYTSASHFHRVTGGRFFTLKPDAQHFQHRWEYASPRYFTCRGSKGHACAATLNRN